MGTHVESYDKALDRGPRRTGAPGWRLLRFGAVLLLLILIAVFARSSFASYDAGAPGAFMRFGSSARSLALGGAGGALGDDAATAYWNPAGLSQLRTMELTAMNAKLFEDTQYSFLSFGVPTESMGTFAFSGAFVSSGEFERTSLFEDIGEEFSEKEGVISISYAVGNSRMGWGVTGKSVSQDIDGYSGSGIGVDAGFYLRPNRHLGLGVSVQNLVAPEITLDQEPEKMARTLRAGGALRFFNNRLLMIADILKTEEMDLKFQGGVESWVLRNVALRCGYDSVREEYSFGGGFRYQNWQVDYAYVSHDLGSTSVLGATMRFGVPDGIRIKADRERFSPAGNERNVTFDVSTAVNGKIKSWSLDIMDGRGELVRQLKGKGSPSESITWGGEDENGRLVGDGRYQAVMSIVDELGQIWDHAVSVEILSFRNRTRTPIRIDISGSGDRDNGGENR